MSGNLPYIEPNKWYHRLINNLTVLYIRMLSRAVSSATKVEITPVWVTGFFRSGTSLVTHILIQLGMDAGPQQYLLKATGKRAELNPDGFFENYLFMDWSLFVFHHTASWGHLPPSEEKTRTFSFPELNRHDFTRFSVAGVHDDRISNMNKASVLKKYNHTNLVQYVNENFKQPCVIKNPHFSVLSPLLVKHWPESTFLVCFRNPESALASAKKIYGEAASHIYAEYYKPLLKLPNEKVMFFSFDELIKNPHSSVEKLCASLQLNATRVSKASSLVKSAQVHFTGHVGNSENDELYKQMLARAINR